MQKAERAVVYAAQGAAAGERAPSWRVLRQGLRVVGPPAAFFVVVVVVWDVFVTLSGIQPYLLPRPARVASALLNPQWRWFEHGVVTSLEVIGGFVLSAVLGMVIGVLVTWSDSLRLAVLPFLVLFNSLPKIALAPLFIIWLGYGIIPNMWIAFLVAFFPVALNTARGVVEIDPDFIDLASILRTTKWRVYWHIRLANALPYIFTGMKVASTQAVVGAIIGEFVASSKGLAGLIMAAQASLAVDIILGALVWISLLGLTLFGFISLVEWWLMPWARHSRKG